MSSRSTLPVLLVTLLGLSTAAWLSSRPQSASDIAEPAATSGGTAGLPPAGIARLAAELTRSVKPAELHPAGGYSAPRGRHLVFDVDGSLATTLSSTLGEEPSAGAGEMVLAWRARMELAVVDRRAEELLVRVRLADLTFTPAGKVRPSDPGQLLELAQEIRTSQVLLRMGGDGQTHGLRFVPEASTQARQWIRTVLAAFRFIVPPDADHLDRWEALEVDTTGTLRASYTWEAACDPQRGTRSLAKRRLEYLPDSTPSGSAQVEGGGQAVWNPLLGWIESAHVSEQLTLEPQDVGFTVAYAFEGRMQLTACEDRPAESEPAPWEGAWESPGSGAAEAGQSPEDHRQWLRSQLGQATLDQLLDELTQALAVHGEDSQEAYMALTRLAWLLELEPEQALALDDLLLSGVLDERTAQLALVALGQSGTPQSQMVLAGWIRDPGRPEALRFAATQSAFQVASPSAELLDSIRSSLHDGAPPPVLGTAMLLLGKLAGPDALQSPELRAALLSELLSCEQDALASGTVDVWLEALGNCADPAIVAYVLPYLAHAAPQVRSAALSALRSVSTPEATQALVQVAQQDLEPALRATAVEMLAAQGSPMAVETICGLALNDASEMVRMAALLALGTLDVTSQLIQETLQDCAQLDSSNAVKDLASSILTGE